MCVTTSMLALDDTPPACPKLKKFFRTARNLLAPVLELPAFTNGGDLKVQLRGIMKSSFQNEMEAQTHVFCTVDEGLSALWTELTESQRVAVEEVLDDAVAEAGKALQAARSSRALAAAPVSKESASETSAGPIANVPKVVSLMKGEHKLDDMRACVVAPLEVASMLMAVLSRTRHDSADDNLQLLLRNTLQELLAMMPVALQGKTVTLKTLDALPPHRVALELTVASHTFFCSAAESLAQKHVAAKAVTSASVTVGQVTQCLTSLIEAMVYSVPKLKSSDVKAILVKGRVQDEKRESEAKLNLVKDELLAVFKVVQDPVGLASEVSQLIELKALVDIVLASPARVLNPQLDMPRSNTKYCGQGEAATEYSAFKSMSETLLGHLLVSEGVSQTMAEAEAAIPQKKPKPPKSQATAEEEEVEDEDVQAKAGSKVHYKEAFQARLMKHGLGGALEKLAATATNATYKLQKMKRTKGETQQASTVEPSNTLDDALASVARTAQQQEEERKQKRARLGESSSMGESLPTGSTESQAAELMQLPVRQSAQEKPTPNVVLQSTDNTTPRREAPSEVLVGQYSEGDEEEEEGELTENAPPKKMPKEAGKPSEPYGEAEAGDEERPHFELVAVFRQYCIHSISEVYCVPERLKALLSVEKKQSVELARLTKEHKKANEDRMLLNDLCGPISEGGGDISSILGCDEPRTGELYRDTDTGGKELTLEELIHGAEDETKSWQQSKKEQTSLLEVTRQHISRLRKVAKELGFFPVETGFFPVETVACGRGCFNALCERSLFSEASLLRALKAAWGSEDSSVAPMDVASGTCVVCESEIDPSDAFKCELCPVRVHRDCRTPTERPVTNGVGSGWGANNPRISMDDHMLVCRQASHPKFYAFPTVAARSK